MKADKAFKQLDTSVADLARAKDPDARSTRWISVVTNAEVAFKLLRKFASTDEAFETEYFAIKRLSSSDPIISYMRAVRNSESHPEDREISELVVRSPNTTMFGQNGISVAGTEHENLRIEDNVINGRVYRGGVVDNILTPNFALQNPFGKFTVPEGSSYQTGLFILNNTVDRNGNTFCVPQIESKTDYEKALIFAKYAQTELKARYKGLKKLAGNATKHKNRPAESFKGLKPRRP